MCAHRRARAAGVSESLDPPDTSPLRKASRARRTGTKPRDRETLPVMNTPSPHRFDDLTALFINCTLKRSPEPSHTQGLVDSSARDHGEARRAGRRAPGRRPRHRHRRLARHDRARLGHRRVAGPLPSRSMAADILVVAGPIWLGDNSSVTKQVIERLYACSAPAQRRRPVRLLRPGRRLPDHRQRGRRQALRDERPLQPAAPRLHDPAAGRRRAGSARPAPARPTSTPARAGRRTTSPTATPPS